MKLQTMHKIVLEILEKQPETRGDDFMLYLAVCRMLNINTAVSLSQALYNHTALKLPSFETVRRCRQKIQSTTPELCSEKIKRKRTEKIAEFFEYATE